MLLQRRTFIRDLCRSGVTVGLLVAGSQVGLAQKASRGQIKTQVGDPAVDIPIEAQRDAVFWFTHETFESYVGGIFQAPNSRGQLVELRLESVEKFVPNNRLTRRSRRSESFSLLFEATRQLPPFTSIHKMQHSALGNFDLFLTPLKGRDGEFLYEAVINHAR